MKTKIMIAISIIVVLFACKKETPVKPQPKPQPSWGYATFVVNCYTIGKDTTTVRQYSGYTQGQPEAYLSNLPLDNRWVSNTIGLSLFTYSVTGIPYFGFPAYFTRAYMKKGQNTTQATYKQLETAFPYITKDSVITLNDTIKIQ